MALLTTRRPAGRVRSGGAYPFLVGIVGLAAATLLAGQGAFAAFSGLVVGGLAVTAALKWRWGVYAVLFYVCVEGAVSNILYTQTYPVLLKDAIILCLYIGCFLNMLKDRDTGAVPRKVLVPMLVFALICVIQSFNPNLDAKGVNGFAVALVGMRVLLYYMPLFFVGMYIGRKPGVLTSLLNYVMAISIPVTLFGIYEYFVGYQFFLSAAAGQSVLGPLSRGFLYVGQESPTGAALILRVSSTFSFTGFFGGFLFFVLLVTIGSLFEANSRRRRVFLGIVLCINSIGFIVQAQRTNWVLLPVAFALIIGLNRQPGLVIRRLPWFAVAAAVTSVVGGSVFGGRIGALLATFGNHLTNGSDQIQQALFSTTALIGNGTGSGLGASRYISGQSVPTVFEGGWAIPVYMLGVWGAIVLIWIYWEVVKAMWQGIMRTRKSERWVPITLLVFVVVEAAVSGSINYPPYNIYFWLFAGVVSALAWEKRPVTEKQEW
jgi:hypothetical protein